MTSAQQLIMHESTHTYTAGNAQSYIQ